jgi:sugar-specific transcriptional regulator TrmB
MIIKPELVKKIKDYFGLNIYETKVWLALTSKGIASAGEIAEISGVPRSRTYDVLESLEKQGFAIAKVGKPTKYIAVKPTLILEKLKKRTLERAEEKMKTLDNLKSTREYEELQELHDSSISLIRKEDLSGAITGKSNILGHVREMLENAENEVIICVPASDLMERSRIFNGLFDKIGKKIDLKLSLNGTDSELKKIEAKYKIKPQKTNINSKFFIIDRKQVLFALTNSYKDEDEIAVWLNSPFFSSALASMFEISLKR